MYCHQCGNRVPQNSKFCPSCGFQFDQKRDATSDQGCNEYEGTFGVGISRGAYLVNLLLSTVLSVFGLIPAFMFLGDNAGMANATLVFGAVVYLGCLVWQIVATVYRLHNTGNSGWWTLLLLVPIANIILVVFCIFAKGKHS